MESNNRITLYMTVLVILIITFLPCAIAQRGSRGGGGEMMRGGERNMPSGAGRGERGRGYPGRGGPFFQNEELSESQIDRIMQEFTKQNPTKAKELEELRKTDKEKFLYELRANAFMIVAQEMREAREYRDLLEWCEKFVSDEATGIRELKEENYDLYKSRLNSLRDKYRSLIYMQRGVSDKLMHVNVRLFQLENTLRDLFRQYRNPDNSSEQKESILEEINVALSERYDKNIEWRKIQYQEIEEEIKRLQAQVDAEMKLVQEYEDPEFKEKEMEFQRKTYTEPRSMPGLRGFFPGGRGRMSPMNTIQDQNSVTDSE